jgi:hypothetical protein
VFQAAPLSPLEVAMSRRWPSRPCTTPRPWRGAALPWWSSLLILRYTMHHSQTMEGAALPWWSSLLILRYIYHAPLPDHGRCSSPLVSKVVSIDRPSLSCDHQQYYKICPSSHPVRGIELQYSVTAGRTSRRAILGLL